MLSLFLSIFLNAIVALASPLARYAQVVGRDTKLQPAYDFVVVGGGTSGLTVANRLTENPETSVLVIEYGYLDNREPEIVVPGLLNYTQYLFNITSLPQRGLNNVTYDVGVAAVVGGGTTVNGMFFDRGSAPDYDAWTKLGNDGWGWEDLLPYFKKAYRLLAQSTNESSSAHRLKENFFRGWQSLGIRTPSDPSGGDANGVFWAPSTLDPNDQTRSYARTAHHDPSSTRSNYHLLTGNAASRILLEDKQATGVEYISRESKELKTVKATKEVILAAGTVHSPQILQLSGVGPKKLLDDLGIESVVDLPGVGQNFQDQPTLYASYDYASNIEPNPSSLYTDETYNDEQLALYYSSRQGPFTICKNSGNTVAFLPLQNTTSDWQTLIDDAEAYPAAKLYPTDTDPSIIAGYNAQLPLLLFLYASLRASVSETGFNGASQFPLTIVKPLSRGSIVINTTDPLAAPLVDYAALTHPVDLDVMLAVLKKHRALIATDAMQELGPVETAPGANVTSDDDLRAALRQQVTPSYYHPCSTCSMMKREHGGVVAPDLAVYGLDRLSVVDASVIPMIPATHTAATVYAIAEKAADIIKARHKL
ncbi:MAG: hypothetical protein M1833_002747 [Piccolia ochrophora]|nr:MAG: hypothetical protein M1833_002747 [Piccolia ochrophora]